MQVKNKKNNRIKIKSVNNLKDRLREEGYDLKLYNEEKFKESFLKIFNINNKIYDKLYKSLVEEEITYKVENINGLVDYIEKIIIFEDEHNKLCEKIKNIRRLNIERVEYERILSTQDDVGHILKIIEELRKEISSKINTEGKLKLEALEEEIDDKYVYAKDIELLKRMIIYNNENVKEEYDVNSQTKKVFIDIPKDIDYKYIKALKGSVEYYQHIKGYIPRMKRLIKNLDKYIIRGNEEGTFTINQSSAIQDSVNMAVALFNGREFRAVSGKNDIENSCLLIPLGKEYFQSCKVNKLGKLGIGYNRINDSEKKILEEIHKQIELGTLSEDGELILYSKWEPCPSCYYVISQFCKKYPKISLKVKYYRSYGE